MNETRSLVEATPPKGNLCSYLPTIRRFPPSEEPRRRKKKQKKRFVTVVFDGITIKRNEFFLIAFYEVEA
jgi:hypothetical protein